MIRRERFFICMKVFFDTILGMLIAFVRLLFLLAIFFLNGVQHILFNKCEINGVTLMLTPQRQDKDKIAYIDKLRCENVDLATGLPIPKGDGVPFRADDEYDDFDDFPDDIDDDDDGDDNDEPSV